MTGAGLDDDPTRRAFEQRVASYVGLGWTIVEREADPLRVRLAFPARRRSNPVPAVVRDSGDRIIWVDEAGEVQVDRVEAQSWD